MSLITELIERLRKEADGYMGYRSKRAVRVKHLLREAADTIETLSAKVQAANMERSTAYYNGDWIPVSERLPEYGKEVLTCSNGGFIEIQSIEGTYDYWENQHGDWSDIDEVITWMPLPTPYDSQERSDKE